MPDDPRPLFVVAGNCMSVSTGPEHAKAIFRAYLDSGADVLELTECADFNAHEVADLHAPGVWRIHQPGADGSAKSGTVLARRVDRTRLHGERIVDLGSRATSEGGGIRDRFIVSALLDIDPDTEHEWSARFAVGHAPPARAPLARARFLARFVTTRGVRGGDMNVTARVLARLATGSRVVGIGVLCLVIPRWIRSGPVRRLPKALLAHADHDGCGIVLWPKGTT